MADGQDIGSVTLDEELPPHREDLFRGRRLRDSQEGVEIAHADRDMSGAGC